MYPEFVGKRVLVTGGGRGIGRAIAKKLVECGAKTFVLTISASSVESIKKEDPDIDVTQVDISDWNNARSAVEAILPIDLLVNNAGAINRDAFLDATQSDIDHVFSTNYKGAFNISQVVARDLVKRKMPGAIVNISSVWSIKQTCNRVVYGTSKAALDSLTRYMALELGPENIRVNAVNPTLIPTDLAKPLMGDTEARNKIVSIIPLGRIGEIREVMDAVLFLLSDSASLINGVTLLLDGGLAL